MTRPELVSRRQTRIPGRLTSEVEADRKSRPVHFRGSRDLRGQRPVDVNRCARSNQRLRDGRLDILRRNFRGLPADEPSRFPRIGADEIGRRAIFSQVALVAADLPHVFGRSTRVLPRSGSRSGPSLQRRRPRRSLDARSTSTSPRPHASAAGDLCMGVTRQSHGQKNGDDCQKRLSFHDGLRFP